MPSPPPLIPVWCREIGYFTTDAARPWNHASPDFLTANSDGKKSAGESRLTGKANDDRASPASAVDGKMTVNRQFQFCLFVPERNFTSPALRRLEKLF